jgi:hypothetical protein
MLSEVRRQVSYLKVASQSSERDQTIAKVLQLSRSYGRHMTNAPK